MVVKYISKCGIVLLGGNKKITMRKINRKIVLTVTVMMDTVMSIIIYTAIVMTKDVHVQIIDFIYIHILFRI